MSSELYEHVRILSLKHRGAGTREEAEARNYIVSVLEKLGYKPQIYYFNTPPSFSYTYIIIYLVIALAPIVSLLGHSFLAILMTIIGLVLLLLEEEFYIPILTTFLGKLFRKKSANVIVEVGRGSHLFILTAHYDSTKAAYSFNPRVVHRLRDTIRLNFASASIVSLLTVIGSILSKPMLLIAIVLSAPLWISIMILVHRELFHSYVPGANDNASGVAVLLGVAKALATDTRLSELLNNTTILIAFTGAEEVGLLGSHMLFRTLKDKLFKAIIINVDNPGAGTLTLTECEGVILRWCSNKAFRERLWKFAESKGLSLVTYQLLPTDATPLMRRGLNVTSLMAFDKGIIRNYHWYSDTIEGIEEENLEKAKNLIIDLLVYFKESQKLRRYG